MAEPVFRVGSERKSVAVEKDLSIYILDVVQALLQRKVDLPQVVAASLTVGSNFLEGDAQNAGRGVVDVVVPEQFTNGDQSAWAEEELQQRFMAFGGPRAAGLAIGMLRDALCPFGRTIRAPQFPKGTDKRGADRVGGDDKEEVGAQQREFGRVGVQASGSDVRKQRRGEETPPLKWFD